MVILEIVVMAVHGKTISVDNLLSEVSFMVLALLTPTSSFHKCKEVSWCRVILHCRRMAPANYL